MTDTNKMISNECGIEMNHHADRIDYTSGIADPVAGNFELGGVSKSFIPVRDAGRPQCGRLVELFEV